MAPASQDRPALKPVPAKVSKTSKTSKGAAEQSRIEAALKEATKHAREQLAAQGLKLPTQGWKRTTIHNPVE